jgi:hypothetical protein
MFIDWVSTEGKMGEMKTERKKKKKRPDTLLYIRRLTIKIRFAKSIINRCSTIDLPDWGMRGR